MESLAPQDNKPRGNPNVSPARRCECAHLRAAGADCGSPHPPRRRLCSVRGVHTCLQRLRAPAPAVRGLSRCTLQLSRMDVPPDLGSLWSATGLRSQRPSWRPSWAKHLSFPCRSASCSPSPPTFSPSPSLSPSPSPFPPPENTGLWWQSGCLPDSSPQVSLVHGPLVFREHRSCSPVFFSKLCPWAPDEESPAFLLQGFGEKKMS